MFGTISQQVRMGRGGERVNYQFCSYLRKDLQYCVRVVLNSYAKCSRGCGYGYRVLVIQYLVVGLGTCHFSKQTFQGFSSTTVLRRGNLLVEPQCSIQWSVNWP